MLNVAVTQPHARPHRAGVPPRRGRVVCGGALRFSCAEHWQAWAARIQGHLEMLTEAGQALVVAAYGAVVSTLVFGWNLYRAVSDRGRLRVRAHVRDLIQRPSWR